MRMYTSLDTGRVCVGKVAEDWGKQGVLGSEDFDIWRRF